MSSEAKKLESDASGHLRPAEPCRTCGERIAWGKLEEGGAVWVYADQPRRDEPQEARAPKTFFLRSGSLTLFPDGFNSEFYRDESDEFRWEQHIVRSGRCSSR